MADVAAGLVIGAVALVPPTLQLIDICATFYSEVQYFGRSTQQFDLKFAHLRSRYDSLQRFLFEQGKFPFAYDTLFRSLPEKDQRIIYAMLQELARLFYKHYAMSQTYRLKYELPEPDLPDVEALAAALTTSKGIEDAVKPVDKHSSLLSLRHMWWASRGKKEAEKLLTEFEGWLRRIRDVLEDTWWWLPAFEKVPNLTSLERDNDAINLGIGTAAGLKKLGIDTTKTPVDLNLDSINLTVEYMTTQRGIASLNDQPLIEALNFEPDKDGFIPHTLARRFEAISNFLHSQSDPDLRVLSCKGHRYSTSPSPQFQLLLEIPSDCEPNPMTLADILGMRLGVKPDLAQRFRLCWQLSQSVISMHSAGWLHRGLRSDNVICFPPKTPKLEREPLASYFFDHFAISGFDSSRLEKHFSLGPYDNAIHKDIYRHPDRWGAPRRTYSRLDDIYGKWASFN
jgi:hypothetical protein